MPRRYLGPQERAVTTALADAKIGERDEGAAELARRYARLIDGAAPAARYADWIRSVDSALETLAVMDPLVGVDYVKAWGKLKEALAEHSVASDLGPKLLAALTALGLTAAGRGAVAPVKGGTTDGSTAAAKPVGAITVDELGQRRDSRANRAGPDGAAPVDSTP